MRTAAIICEYNPFHPGHARHISLTRDAGADAVVCIMSGSFTQRGDAAVFSKWSRASMALDAGADVVLELPALFSLQSAEGFARGAVRIADGIHSDLLSFGAEETDLTTLREAAYVLTHETDEMSQRIVSLQKQGHSHARARYEALKEHSPELGALLMGPNNILAVEYLRAISSIESRMHPFAVARPAPVDPQRRLDRGSLCTSSSIRSALRDADSAEKRHLMQDLGYNEEPFFAEDRMFVLLEYVLGMSEDLPDSACINTAIVSRLRKSLPQASTLQQLIESAATRWLPAARVRRALIHALLGTKKRTLESVNLPSSPVHARLLGYRESRRSFLGNLIDRSVIPIVTRFREYPETELAKADIRAGDLYTILRDVPPNAARERAHPPVVR